MELSQLLGEVLLGNSSINTLSESSGASKDQVKQVLGSALPTLLQNMKKNASTESGEAALAKALSDHAKDDTKDISSFLKNVNIEDGTKILGHILGDDKKTVETGIAKKSGLTSGQTSTILATAAPLLLSLLGSKKDEEGGKKDSGGLLEVLASALLGGSGGLGNALSGGLGSLLTGGNSQDGGALGSIIGSLLGGDDIKKPEAKPAAKKKTTAKKPTTEKTATAEKKAASKTTAKKKG